MAFRRRTKSYPLFSQEFVIHNHADIGFCLVLCVLIGLMFEVTAKTAFLFILPQYNVSVPTADGETVHYHYGPKDLVTISFYIFITIILHAVVQEYILDKISKRLHLSKVKHSKFNESGQLVVFHLSSVIWCFYVVVTEGYLTNPRSLWEDYPHVYLPFQVKFFYLCQLAYWLHALPELYFQKVRKEEIPRQLQYICLYLVHIAGAYLLNRLGLVLLLLQYSTEFLFHTARLCHFADENNEKLFNAWAAVFGVTRLFILTLAVLAIGFGLARMENQAFDPEKGNFNTTEPPHGLRNSSLLKGKALRTGTLPWGPSRRWGAQASISAPFPAPMLRLKQQKPVSTQGLFLFLTSWLSLLPP
uniref:Translocation associated membrane protein 2 n=1 Tax=Sus scrofa TaxID=9823 RepID=A0A8D1C607_PIG